jgi:hypothetical protein
VAKRRRRPPPTSGAAGIHLAERERHLRLREADEAAHADVLREVVADVGADVEAGLLLLLGLHVRARKGDVVERIGLVVRDRGDHGLLDREEAGAAEHHHLQLPVHRDDVGDLQMDGGLLAREPRHLVALDEVLRVAVVPVRGDVEADVVQQRRVLQELRAPHARSRRHPHRAAPRRVLRREAPCSGQIERPVSSKVREAVGGVDADDHPLHDGALSEGGGVPRAGRLPGPARLGGTIDGRGRLELVAAHAALLAAGDADRHPAFVDGVDRHGVAALQAACAGDAGSHRA